MISVANVIKKQLKLHRSKFKDAAIIHKLKTRKENTNSNVVITTNTNTNSNEIEKLSNSNNNKDDTGNTKNTSNKTNNNIKDNNSNNKARACEDLYMLQIDVQEGAIGVKDRSIFIYLLASIDASSSKQ